jgi:hypothetical protein
MTRKYGRRIRKRNWKEKEGACGWNLMPTNVNPIRFLAENQEIQN